MTSAAMLRNPTTLFYSHTRAIPVHFEFQAYGSVLFSQVTDNLGPFTPRTNTIQARSIPERKFIRDACHVICTVVIGAQKL